MRRIVIACLKGGSSKTSTATALAVGLVRRGARVLAVDLDPQADASWTLSGGQGAEGPTVADVLARRAAAEEAIRPTATPGLDLLPSDGSLAAVAVELASAVSRDARLRRALEPIDDRYDYAVVDTGPAVSTLLANALVYGAEVITPVDMGVYAVVGLVELREVIGEVADAYGNRELHHAGLLLTKVGRTNLSRDTEAGLRERFGPLVYRSTVPLSAKVDEAHSRGQTVLDWAPKSPAALAYAAFVEEVIRGRSQGRGGVETGGDLGAAGDAAA